MGISSKSKAESTATGRERWKEIATHPISIIASTSVVVAGIVFSVIKENRIVPLEKRIEWLEKELESAKPEKDSKGKVYISMPNPTKQPTPSIVPTAP